MAKKTPQTKPNTNAENESKQKNKTLQNTGIKSLNDHITKINAV